MKVLITYVSAGSGHRKAAEALFEYLKDSRSDLELKLIDVLDYTNPFFRFLYSKGYILLISKLSWLWYISYLVSFICPKNVFRTSSEYLNCLKFIAFLKNEQPDVIVSTHFITSSLLTLYKKNILVSPKLIAIVTDYTLHPYWVGEGVDIYVVSCSRVRDELTKRGINADKIRVYGIPVSKQFYLTSDRKAVAEKLKVNSAMFTVLIMTGAIGIGPIEEIVKTLSLDNLQILVVCGNNERLFSRLNGLNLIFVKVYPLVNNVDELMSVSDIILTKAGGLTITESLAKSLPMVFFSSIPGLETKNADTILSLGAGTVVARVDKIRETVLSLRQEKVNYEKMLNNVRRLRNSNTLSSITSEITSSLAPSQPSCHL